MSRLGASRDQLTAALAAGGVNVATTGQFSAPCVIVEPGDPWAGVDMSMGRQRVARWYLTIVAGRSDSDGSLELLAELVDRVDAALLAVPGVQLPTWARPFSQTLAQVQYAASSATIQTTTARPEEALR